MLAADGRVLWFHSGMSAEASEGTTTLHGVSADVTEIKEASRTREEVIALVSRELEGPLREVAVNAERLERLGGTTRDVRHAAHAIHRAAENMSRSIAALNAASAPTGGC
jgi:signal transduction histidine kinase